MSQTYFFLFLLVFFWTVNPFMKKNASQKLTSGEYLVFNHALCTIIVVIYLLYLLKYNKCDINCLRKLNNKDIFYSILAAITTIGSSLVLIHLVQNNNVSYIIPQIQPLVILSTVITGYLFFGEMIEKQKLFGIGLIISGLYVINSIQKK